MPTGWVVLLQAGKSENERNGGKGRWGGGQLSKNHHRNGKQKLMAIDDVRELAAGQE